MSRISEHYLGDDTYPLTPGWIEPTTSKLAAEKISGTCDRLRATALKIISEMPRTADEVATILDVTVLACRPRITELRKMGLIRPLLKADGRQVRRENASGSSAIVWEKGAE